MITSKISLGKKSISSLFSDENLTKKASLNTLALGLDYAARLLVGLIITPLMVTGLGTFFYGVWQVLNRLVWYLSPASRSSTQVLKWSLANQKASSDGDQKRRLVGSALVVGVLFFPLVVMGGGVIIWFAPIWVKAQAEFFWPIRLTAGFLMVNLMAMACEHLPRAVAQGENIGYKRLGMSAFLILVGGGVTWIVLYFDLGIVGVAIAAVVSTLLTGLFWLWVAQKFTPWFGIARPSLEKVGNILRLSWWFLGWELVMSVMTVSDVVLLGMLNSVESVTQYTLSKYVPETLISIAAIIVTGIAPGLGSIIGSGELRRAANVRNEVMALTWLMVTVAGSTMLLWNRAFISLRVGVEHYVGSTPALLIAIVVTQFILIQNDSYIIDLTLHLRRKVQIGALSVVLSLLFAGLLVGYFRLGVAGLCLGLIAGRSILSIGYPVLIGRFLQVPFQSQIRATLRPALVTALFFSLALGLDFLLYLNNLIFSIGWIGLFLWVGMTALIVFALAFWLGLSSNQRKLIFLRISVMLSLSPDFMDIMGKSAPHD